MQYESIRVVRPNQLDPTTAKMLGLQSLAVVLARCLTATLGYSQNMVTNM